MSEEIKNIEDLLDVFEYTDGIYYLGDYSNITIANFIRNLQQKVEQLEKENKELNRMCELYSQSLYNADLTKAEKKVEQLENIRKEAIELIKKYQRKDEFLNLNEWQTRDLLNILNKGDNNVKD